MCNASSINQLTVSDIIQKCTLIQRLTFHYLHISNAINAVAVENILPLSPKVIQHCLILRDTDRDAPMLVRNVPIFCLSNYLRFSVSDMALNNLVNAFSFSIRFSFFLGEILIKKQPEWPIIQYSSIKNKQCY
jgi:hypothetical protein